MADLIQWKADQIILADHMGWQKTAEVDILSLTDA